MRILTVLLEIVIGLALVGTVATSTTSGSTALAAFTNAQALVIIIPLIFVAIILYAALEHFKRGGRKGMLVFEGLVRLAVMMIRSVVERVAVFVYQLRLYQRA